MNWIDYLLLGIVLFSIVAILLYLRKKPSSCHTSCSSCSKSTLCSKEFWENCKQTIQSSKKSAD